MIAFWFVLDSSAVGDMNSPWIPIPPESFKFKSSAGNFCTTLKGLPSGELVLEVPRSCATRFGGAGEVAGDTTDAGLLTSVLALLMLMFWEDGGRDSLLTRD